MRNYFRNGLHTIFFAFALCLSLSAVALSQQETSATITGNVTDAAGAVVSNATVTVTNKSTGSERRVQTNGDGNYVVTPLTPGTYTVAIEQTNFKRNVQENVVLNINDRRPINVALEIGVATETVTVTGDASVVQDSPTTQTLISGTQVIELPLNNRNFLKLTELVPGVSSDLDDESSFGLTSRTSISINGMRRNAVNYFVDGVSNSDVGSNITLLSTPTVDSIQEFKVLTSNYTAEIGRSGGGAVTIVTRGGGNDYHGSLYEFLRNDYTSANSFFNNRIPRRADGSLVAVVPKLRYNNFGGTFSGPLPTPRFGEGGRAYESGRNKTFFFYSEELRRVIRGTTDASATVPNAAQRSGDFSSSLGSSLFRQSNGTSGTTATATPLFVTDTNGNVIQARAGQIFNANGLAFAGNVIPQSNFSPQALSLLPAFPLPTNGLNGFTFTPININNTRQESLRIDHNFSDNYRIFGRYTHDLSQTQESGGLFTGRGLPNIATTNTNVPGQVFAVSFTSVLSPKLVNEATYNFSGNAINSQLVGRGRRSDYPGSETIAQVFPENNNNAIPTVSITGFTTIGSLQGFNIRYRNNVVRDTATLNAGNHTIKFGGEVSFESKDENANNVTQGSFAFNGTNTRGVSSTGVALSQTGVALADYLVGRPSSYSEDERDVTVNLRFGRREFFGQDTFKLRPNLTLDYGVRYQYFTPVRDKNNVLTSFDPTLFSAAAAPTCTTAACTSLVRGTGNVLNGIAVAGVNSRFGRAITPSDKNNFSPRVGIAYSPFKDSKTVIRAGYGFYYDQVLVGIFEVNSFVNPPFNNSVTYTGSTLSFTNPTAGALGALPVRNLNATAPDFKTPETQQYSLGIQREIFRNAVIDVSYVGTKGDHLIRRYNLNFAQPTDVVRISPATGTTVTNPVRPFIGYGTITYFNTVGVSRYNGLLSSFIYRFGNGLSLTAAYTFSKNLTDSTNDRDLIDEPQNPLNLRADYAEARTSRPHVFSSSYVYILPFFTKSQSALKRNLLGDFEISGITTIASGPPVPRIIVDTNGGRNGNFADVVGDPRSGLAGTRDPVTGLPFFFDPTAFAPPANGTFGNSSRAFARAPGQNQTNLSLSKNFFFNRDKNRRLQLRAEGFNVFNHTQFLISTSSSQVLPLVPVSSNLNTSLVGRPTATRLPREFQFGAKLYF